MDFEQNDKFRFEFKYEVSPVAAESLKRGILIYGFRKDPFVSKTKEKDYIVSSVYFDTPFFDDYDDKAGGFLRRRKIRARIYGKHIGEETDFVWLEQKYKYDMMIHKERIKLTIPEWENFVRHGPFSLPKNKIKGRQNEIIYRLLKERRRPAVYVRYKREPYVLGFYDMFPIRITFDSSIEACKASLKSDLKYLSPMAPVMEHSVIMEVKFNQALPFWFAGLIKKYGLRRNAYSKYGLSIEAVNRRNSLPR